MLGELCPPGILHHVSTPQGQFTLLRARLEMLLLSPVLICSVFADALLLQGRSDLGVCVEVLKQILAQGLYFSAQH